MPSITELHVNGQNVRVNADPERTLLSVLRDDLGVTGCKYGCGEGQCGACTALLDGVPTRSCVTPLREVAARKITTVEGLEKDGRLHPLQESFLAEDALQCGYCTPGMILAGVALLRENPDPSVPEIARAMNGQICRCGAYQRIIAAIQSAAKTMRKEAK